MMKTFEHQQFVGCYDRNSGRVFEDLEFHRCTFQSSALSITRDPRLRSTVRRVRLVDCEENGCALDCAIVEEVVVNGLRTHGLLQTWGAVFRHVTLKGKIGRIMISDLIATARATPKQQQAFDEANAAYYASVDWALDISEAEFQEADLRGVPAHLVRRDPVSQAVVTWENALRGRWREPDLAETYWAGIINFHVQRKSGRHGDILLVAPKRRRNYRQLLEEIQRLREAGVAEPD